MNIVVNIGAHGFECIELWIILSIVLKRTDVIQTYNKIQLIENPNKKNKLLENPISCLTLVTKFQLPQS